MVRLSFRFFFLIFIIALSLLLNSCSAIPGTGHSTETLEEGSAKTVLRFISSWGGVDSKAKTLKDILAQFIVDNPDIAVVNDSLFGEDFLPKIKTDFASGNNPDVFGLWPGSDIASLVKAGKVAELSGLLDADMQWKESFNRDMWDYTTYDGKIYGLPLEVIFECLFINRDLFEKYNVRIPETFDDLKAAVGIFKENGIIPIALNTFSEGTFLYQNIIAMIGGREDTENPFEDGKVKSCYIRAMEYVKELYDLGAFSADYSTMTNNERNNLGAFPADCFTMTNNERNTLFKEKKAAMIVQGSWFIGDFGADDKTVDIICMPLISELDKPQTTMVYGIGGGSFHLSRTATRDEKKYEASVKLLKALTSEKAAVTFASDTGMISNVNIDKYNINYSQLAIKGRRMLSETSLLVGPPDSFVDRSCWEKDIAQQFPYYLEGEISAEDVWAKAISSGIVPD